MIIAGIGQLARLSRWRGLSALRASIVFVLHIGYFWLGAGFILLGISILWDGLLSADAIHGLTIGAIGTMIPAVMSRASLGHSGRPIAAGLLISLVYLIISLAVIARLSAGLMPQFYMPLINISGIFWIIAFLLFAVKFTPLYFKPRAPR